MEPFGQGNPEPVFLMRNIQLEEVRRLREHLKFSLRMNGTVMSGIGFFMADLYETALGRIHFSFKLKETCFRGKKRIEVHAVLISGN